MPDGPARGTWPRVDIGALTNSITAETTDRLASLLVCFPRYCEEGLYAGELSELQKIELAKVALSLFDGLERSVAEILADKLQRDDVIVWGADERLGVGMS